MLNKREFAFNKHVLTGIKNAEKKAEDQIDPLRRENWRLKNRRPGKRQREEGLDMELQKQRKEGSDMKLPEQDVG